MDAIELLRGAVAIGAGFFIGAIPFGIVVTRLSGKPDPRTIGSGRTGGANVMRAAGFRTAAVAGLLDLAKGAVGVFIARLLGAGLVIEILAALAAVIGHSRSPYIGWGGGRGVAPAFGGLLVMQPLIALVSVLVFLGVFFVGRYTSLASLTSSFFAGAASVVLVLAGVLPPLYLVYGVAGAGLIWLFHHDNIARLLSGTEPKLNIGRRTTTPVER
jgi:glycerol-3-phosphate acyltransferase PlsY